MLQSLRRVSQHAAGIATLGCACTFAGVAVASEKTVPQGLNPAGWEELTVIKKEKAPIGSTKEDGTKKDVIRPYTPTSDPETRGFFDLMVKVYDLGNMSKHLGEMGKGDTVLCKGPIKKLPYEANMKKKIGMIAGGSGITPMLQIVDAVVKDESDTTEVFLVYANKTPQDILLKEKLDTLAKTHDNIHVHYVVEKKGMFDFVAPFSTGYVNAEVLEKHCPPASGGEDNLVLVCGPPPMMKAISGDKAADKSQGELTGLLAKVGYTAEQVYKF